METKQSILLINTPSIRIVEAYDLPGYPHIGLGYLVSYLSRKGVEVSVIDAKLERLSTEEIIERLTRSHFDFIGISSMTHEIMTAAYLARRIKEKFNSVKIILGGVHSTALPQESLKEFSDFDISVMGEGEETLYEIASGVDLEDIKGIAFRQADGNIQVNEKRDWIQDLDSLPFPAWEFFPQCKTYHILTARGCFYECIFCMSPYGRQIRERSVNNVFSEIKQVIERYHPKFLKFNDETFAFNKARAHSILDLIIENGLHKTPKSASMRANLIDFDLLKKMKKAGFVYVDYGVESGNSEVLKTIKKGVTLEQTKNAICLTKKAKIKVGANYILGHPYETLETAQQTINYAVRLNADVNAIGIMVPYPGTQIYKLAKEGMGGYVILSQNWNDYNKQLGGALELKGLKRKQLEKLQLAGYLKILVCNFRIIGLMQFIIKHRRAGIAFLANFFKK